MIKTIFLVLLLFLLTCYASAQVSVTFIAADTSSAYPDPDLITIAIKQQGRMIDSLDESFVPRWKVTLPGPGLYEVIYETVFRTRRRMDLVVTNQMDTVRLFVHELGQEKGQEDLLIDRLKPGQEMTIHFRTEGCWMLMHQDLNLKRKKDHYVAAWDDTLVTLTPWQVNCVGRFERELQYFRDNNNCTTQDYYTLQGPGQKAGGEKYMDGSCDWLGFYNLMKALGARDKWWADKNEWNR